MDPAHARIAKLADRLQRQALAVSHKLHAHPALGHHGVASAKLLTEFCREFGFEVATDTAGFPTAFRPAHRGPDAGAPTIGILAEYDAVPEIGHACGHNMIATVATGAGDRCVMTGIKTLAATGWDLLLADGGFRAAVQTELPATLEAQR